MLLSKKTPNDDDNNEWTITSQNITELNIVQTPTPWPTETSVLLSIFGRPGYYKFVMYHNDGEQTRTVDELETFIGKTDEISIVYKNVSIYDGPS
jgi:hypothetical protein